MAIELEGLEFQINGEVSESVKSLKSLTKALESLKGQLGSGWAGAKRLNENLQNLGQATKGVPNNGAKKLSELSRALGRLGDVSISSSIARQITNIGEAARGLSPASVRRVESLASALERLRGASAGGAIQIPTQDNTPAPQDITPAPSQSPNPSTPDQRASAERRGPPQSQDANQATGAVQRLRAALQQASQGWQQMAQRAGASRSGRAEQRVWHRWGSNKFWEPYRQRLEQSRECIDEPAWPGSWWAPDSQSSHSRRNR